MSSNRNIRLFVDQKLISGEQIVLPEKVSHYLGTVMRCYINDTIKCFNAADGEFSAEIKSIEKKQTIVTVRENLRKPAAEPDIWLLFAPLKKDKTDFVIEKAVELGVSRIIPVITSRTNTTKVKTDRFVAQAIEAAEQCERFSVPKVEESISLEKLVKKWNDSRILFFMDERRTGEEAAKAFSLFSKKSAALLIGPEGGFDKKEEELLESCSFVKSVSLGPRILRAETAVAAALAVWQASAGDWRKD